MEWDGLFTKAKGKLRLGAIVTECVKAPVRKKRPMPGWLWTGQHVRAGVAASSELECPC